MKKINQSNLRLLHSCITHFIGEPITDISRFDETLMFKTITGKTGIVEPNWLGNMDIWIGETVVYEIEKELFDILEYDRKEIGLIEFYNKVKEVDTSEFKQESYHFFMIVKTSTENIILNYELELVGDTVIRDTQIHYTSDQKMKIHLN